MLQYEKNSDKQIKNSTWYSTFNLSFGVTSNCQNLIGARRWVPLHCWGQNHIMADLEREEVTVEQKLIKWCHTVKRCKEIGKINMSESSHGKSLTSECEMQMEETVLLCLRSSVNSHTFHLWYANLKVRQQGTADAQVFYLPDKIINHGFCISFSMRYCEVQRQKTHLQPFPTWWSLVDL